MLNELKKNDLSAWFIRGKKVMVAIRATLLQLLTIII